MPGPLVHRASTKVVKSLLKSDYPISIKLTDYMYPDLTRDSHGYDLNTNEGSLLEHIEQCYNELSKSLKLKKDCNRLILSLCHYLTDAHSVGQINKSLWGDIDNKLDVCGEFVWNKGMILSPISKSYTFSEFMTMLNESMQIVNTRYYNKVKTNLPKFIIKDLKYMVVDEIYYGALYTDLLFRMAKMDR